MTNNQIQYQKLLEEGRSNRVQEAAKVRELSERERSNRMTEQLGRDSLEETRRSNLARERETNRSNLAKEFEQNRSNTASESIARQQIASNETIQANRLSEDTRYHKSSVDAIRRGQDISSGNASADRASRENISTLDRRARERQTLMQSATNMFSSIFGGISNLAKSFIE